MNTTKNRPSDAARAAGLASLAEMSRITGQSDRTLENWFKNKPDLFRIVAKGAAVEKAEKAKN